MKSLETQYSELKEKAVASGKITEAQIKDKLADYGTKRHAFAGPILLEEQLSVLKKIVAEVGITESVELRESRPRITRNNGSGTVVTESDQSARVESYARKLRVSLTEAAAYLGVKPQTEKKPNELAEAWHKYCKALTPAECEALAARNVPVPER
jgi:hypothetical protein